MTQRSLEVPQFEAGERFLTVGVVAKYFGVTEVTIKNWVDGGTLQAARTVGGHRRVAASSVARLLEAQGRAVPAGLSAREAVVLALDDAAVLRAMKKALGAAVRLHAHSDVYSALLALARLSPEVLVLDTSKSDVDPKKLVRALQADAALQGVHVVAVGGPRVQAVKGAEAKSLTVVKRGDAAAVVDAVIDQLNKRRAGRR